MGQQNLRDLASRKRTKPYKGWLCNKKQIGGYKHQYPQAFLDQLAKDLGFKWTKVKFTCIEKEQISVKPLPPPTGILFYLDCKFEK